MSVADTISPSTRSNSSVRRTEDFEKSRRRRRPLPRTRKDDPRQLEFFASASVANLRHLFGIAKLDRKSLEHVDGKCWFSHSSSCPRISWETCAICNIGQVWIKALPWQELQHTHTEDWFESLSWLNGVSIKQACGNPKVKCGRNSGDVEACAAIYEVPNRMMLQETQAEKKNYSAGISVHSLSGNIIYLPTYLPTYLSIYSQTPKLVSIIRVLECPEISCRSSTSHHNPTPHCRRSSPFGECRGFSEIHCHLPKWEVISVEIPRLISIQH